MRSVRTAFHDGPNGNDYAMATPTGDVTWASPTAIAPIDVADQLVGAGQPNLLRHLRITAVLSANAARSSSPVLRSFELTFNCMPVR